MIGRVHRVQIAQVALMFVVLVVMPAMALAQAAPAAAPPPPPKHEDTGELSFVGVSGNASTTTFGLGYETIARPGTCAANSFASSGWNSIPSASGVVRPTWPWNAVQVSVESWYQTCNAREP